MKKKFSGKKIGRPLVKHLEQIYWVSERHACCVLELAQATHRYEGRQEPLRKIAQARVRCGYLHDPCAVEP